MNGMHTHICMKCAEEKKNVTWVHSDNCAGVIGKHVCPECGTINWRKYDAGSGQLPNQGTVMPNSLNSDGVFAAVILAVVVAALVYIGILYVQKKKLPALPVA